MKRFVCAGRYCAAGYGMREAQKKLGDALVCSGIISEQQLAKALEILSAGAETGRREKKGLGQVLTELSFVPEDELATALALQLNLPQVDPGAISISGDVFQLVTREIAESNLIIPYEKEGQQLRVAMSNPLDLLTMDDLRFHTGMNIAAAVATESSILNAIERCYRVEAAIERILQKGDDLQEIEFIRGDEDDTGAFQAFQQSQTAPIIKLVGTIMLDAIKRRATDIHIEPREKYVQIRYRIDGNLHDAFKLPKQNQASVTYRIKTLGGMDAANRLIPQDGSTKMRYGNNSVDLRISTLPGLYGEKAVIRILDRSKGLLPPAKLGVPEVLIKKLHELESKSQGMVVVAGPAGSGRTTTLYGFLQLLSDPASNIITVEDPVEYYFPGITQVSVREQAGLGFAAFMKSALRQDPDIILAGEICDLETAEIALRASLTGRFVLTALHANDAFSSIARLVDLGVQPFLVSSSLSAILAQRLVRKICDNCRMEIPYPDEQLPSEFPRLPHAYIGRGCPQCDFTGFRGQTGVFEYLDINAQMKRLIANNAPDKVLREEAAKMGMASLFHDAWKKVSEGITTIPEVMGRIPSLGRE
jgi:type IV pilus assembly protein PilB